MTAGTLIVDQGQTGREAFVVVSAAKSRSSGTTARSPRSAPAPSSANCRCSTMAPGPPRRSVRPTARCSSSTSAASSASSTTSRRSRTSCWRAWPARSASSTASTTVTALRRHSGCRRHLMNFSPLPDDWPDQRDTLRFLAAHLLAQARQRHDGLFDLVPLPGRFRHAARRAGPANGFASSADRCSSNASRGDHDSGRRAPRRRSSRSPGAVARRTVPAARVRAASRTSGSATTRRRSVTPTHRSNSTGRPRRSSASGTCSASERSTRSSPRCPTPTATVGRLWPEHFDYGIDLDAAPGVRCNLGRGRRRRVPRRAVPLRRPAGPGATGRRPTTGTHRSAPCSASATSTWPTTRSARPSSSS